MSQLPSHPGTNVEPARHTATSYTLVALVAGFILINHRDA